MCANGSRRSPKSAWNAPRGGRADKTALAARLIDNLQGAGRAHRSSLNFGRWHASAPLARSSEPLAEGASETREERQRERGREFLQLCPTGR